MSVVLLTWLFFIALLVRVLTFMSRPIIKKKRNVSAQADAVLDSIVRNGGSIGIKECRRNAGAAEKSTPRVAATVSRGACHTRALILFPAFDTRVSDIFCHSQCHTNVVSVIQRAVRISKGHPSTVCVYWQLVV